VRTILSSTVFNANRLVLISYPFFLLPVSSSLINTQQQPTLWEGSELGTITLFLLLTKFQARYRTKPAAKNLLVQLSVMKWLIE
jgi:hypothetical protein